MDVTGTEAAIRRMVVSHTVELNKMPGWSAQTEEIPGGQRLTVVAKIADDTKTVARIRGLGFIGLLTERFHRQPHHLALAKGENGRPRTLKLILLTRAFLLTPITPFHIIDSYLTRHLWQRDDEQP